MTDENIGRAVRIALKPRSELVALTGRIKRVEHLADRLADNILRQFGTVFRPVRFHDPGIRRIDIDQKTVVLPEIPDLRPQHFRRTVHDQPALIAIPFDTDIRRLIGCHHAAHSTDSCPWPRFLTLLIVVGRRNRSVSGMV